MPHRFAPAALTRRHWLGAVAAALAACRSGPAPLRLSGIPDGDKSELKRRFAAVAQFLTRAVGRPVEYVHVPDYTAAVTALAARKIDLAWLGGVTTVQAEQRAAGGIQFIAAREADLHFRSYIVCNRDVLEATSLAARPDRTSQSLADLSALAPTLRSRKFSFGAKNSTSGHIMPRAFLTDAAVGLDPERDFDGGPVYQLKGGHAATLRAVASGAVDFGVLNFAVWDAADATLQAQAPVVYVTPEYVDYCLVAHDGVSSAEVARIREALTGLDADKPQEQAVLAAFSAERFVGVDGAAWDGIRSVLAQLEGAGALQ